MNLIVSENRSEEKDNETVAENNKIITAEKGLHPLETAFNSTEVKEDIERIDGI